MEIDLSKMCDWERKKAVYLLGIAEDLGMNTSRYGQLAVNPNSGYTYLWLEDYNFSLFMPIECELKKSDVLAIWSCLECGKEEEINLKESDRLEDIENRISDIETEHYEDAHPEKLKC